MNPLVSATPPTPALLALEDGTCLSGFSAGAPGTALGEIVFNTSMTGYQEIVTDPSYAGQVVCLTYPQVGNYGVNPYDMQGRRPWLEALVVADMCYRPSNWQSVESLPAFLSRHGVVAVEGVDTRRLTLAIREAGAMRCAVSTVVTDPAELVGLARSSTPISEKNLVARVSCEEPFRVGSGAFGAPRVVAVDCGEKTGIERRFTAAGIDVAAVPWDTPAEEVLALRPDGVFFSNGPGDPASVPEVVACAEALLGRVPAFGICLGNQVMALAAGATVEKLPFGHHGGNEPVMNLLTGTCEVTAQNHNYGPVFESFGPLVAEESGGCCDHEADLRAWCRRRVAPVAMNPRVGRVRLTHVNLNDGTCEGVQFLDAAAFSMQYHPEARPGPSDASYAFSSFARLMAGDPDYLAVSALEGRRA